MTSIYCEGYEGDVFSYETLRIMILRIAHDENIYGGSKSRFHRQLLNEIEARFDQLVGHFSEEEMRQWDSDALVFGPLRNGHNFQMASAIVSNLPESMRPRLPLDARTWHQRKAWLFI